MGPTTCLYSRRERNTISRKKLPTAPILIMRNHSGFLSGATGFQVNTLPASEAQPVFLFTASPVNAHYWHIHISKALILCPSLCSNEQHLLTIEQQEPFTHITYSAQIIATTIISAKVQPICIAQICIWLCYDIIGARYPTEYVQYVNGFQIDTSIPTVNFYHSFFSSLNREKRG